MRLISNSFLINTYYHIKPFIPRRLQIKLRGRVILRKRSKYSNVWPINEKASKPPERWPGWPEGKRFALVLTHDVDTARGQEKCIQLAAVEEKFGFRSSFNFVAEEYHVLAVLRSYLADHGFEIGVHGLTHNGNPFRSKKVFQEQATRINEYLKDWKCVGFRSPGMYHNLDWIGELNIDYDASTFDTDPFEPQPDGMGTIFPFWVAADGQAATSSAISLTPGSNGPELQPGTCNPQPATVSQAGFVELPYTLPQDFTLFVLMKERNIDIWKKKLDWIVENGGMALLNIHPDYMNFKKGKCEAEEYPAEFFEEWLDYVKTKYEGQYWHALPREMAYFWKAFTINQR
jgi:peptidoglycan/xylan/chitin deacetylase (PgdA/CDA1 family)